MSTVTQVTSGNNSIRDPSKDLSMEKILRAIAKDPKMENPFKKEITRTFFDHIPWKENWSDFLEKAPPIGVIHLKYLIEGLPLLGRNYFSAEEKEWCSVAMAHLVALEMLAKKSIEYNSEEAMPYFKEYLQFLGENGFDVNQLHNEKREYIGAGRPLHFAALKGCPAICKALVLLGANVNLSEKETRTIMPLHLAAYTGDVKTVQTLIELGADVNAIVFDQFFWPWFVLGNDSNPLCFAAKHTQVIQILVDKGANVNHVCGDYNAHSPLKHALLNENFEGANILLQKGAIAFSTTVICAKKKFKELMDKKRKIENAEKEIHQMKDAYALKKRLKGNGKRSS